MFPVEVRIEEPNKDVLAAKMAAMRDWLDHRRLNPSGFRSISSASGFVLHLDFHAEADAMMFAKQFDGLAVRKKPEMASPKAAAD